MPKVVKGNTELDIQDVQLPYYLANGYDQIDEKGTILAVSEKRRAVADLEAEIKRLRARVAELEAQAAQERKKK